MKGGGVEKQIQENQIKNLDIGSREILRRDNIFLNVQYLIPCAHIKPREGFKTILVCKTSLTFFFLLKSLLGYCIYFSCIALSFLTSIEVEKITFL